jgi:hypothetical protein
MAAHKLLSALAIKAARAAGRECWLTDDTGLQGTGRLMLRISRGGAGHWFFRLPRGTARPHGTIPLGPYSFRQQPGALTLTEAREQARTMTALLLAPQATAALQKLQGILGSAQGPCPVPEIEEPDPKSVLSSTRTAAGSASMLHGEPSTSEQALDPPVSRCAPRHPSAPALRQFLSSPWFCRQFRARNVEIMLEVCRGRTLASVAAQHGLTSPACGQMIRRNLNQLAETFLAADLRADWVPPSLYQFSRGRYREYWLPLLVSMAATAPPDTMPPSVADVPADLFVQEILRTSLAGDVLRDPTHLSVMLDVMSGVDHEELRSKFGLGYWQVEGLVTQSLKAHAAHMNLRFLSNVKVGPSGRTRGQAAYLKEALRLLLDSAAEPVRSLPAKRTVALRRSRRGEKKVHGGFNRSAQHQGCEFISRRSEA